MTAVHESDLYRMLREKQRKQAEHLAELGQRPPWWRPLARRNFDRMELRIMQWHAADFDLMLKASPDHRSVIAMLIGWDLE